MSGGLPLSTLDVFEMTHVIALTVLDDMRLVIEPQEIARDAEHNSATFRIVQQPASLDQLVCRAEVQTIEGTNYRLVEGGEFSLTNDIAVQGTNTLQLVYSDGGDIIRKTYKTPFHVSASINAIDPSDPEYENGLAQITRAAFTAVRSPGPGGDVATFLNIAGQEVGILIFPPGQGSGLDEAQANLLYVRQDGTTVMSGDLRMIASAGIDGPIGVYIGGRQASIYWANALQLRRGQAGEPVQVANNDGSAASDVLTVQTGDARYPTLAYSETAYARLAGANFTGPLITAPGGSLTNPGLGIGDNATGFFRTGTTLLLTVGGQLYAQWLGSPPSLMMTVPLNMATQAITNVPTPNAATDAANRAYVDSAVAAVPRPAIPAARTYIANEVTIGVDGQPVQFFNQPFFTNDNQPRTILVTVYPQFDSGTPSSFYELEYSTGLSAGLIEKMVVYPTPASYMGAAAVLCFAATVTPVSSQIQVSLSVRQASNQPTPLIQVGSRATQRSYVVIQEMTS